MPHIKAVFFDLDETLLDDERTSLEAQALATEWAAKQRPGLDANLLGEAYHQANITFWKTYNQETESRSGEEIRRDMWLAGLVACGVDDAIFAEQLAATFMRFRNETYALFPDAEPCLDALHGRYRLGLISNGATYIQMHKAEALNLGRWMDVIVVAEMAGISKPDRGIFDYALEKIGCRAEEAVMVGDLLERDILGALNAGLTPVWINRPPVGGVEHAVSRANRLSNVPPPEHVIGTLNKLPPLLERISSH